jgi:type I protein arginine methyltransferase
MAYTLDAYARMASDPRRLEAFTQALQNEAVANKHVLDLGAGFGVCTLLALAQGAKHVTAIESNDAIRWLPRLVTDQGFDAARVTVLHGDSRAFTLSSLADVVVSDLRGCTPFFGAHFHALRDARTRHLRPGGSMIPKGDVVFACPVEAPALRQLIASDVPNTIAGFDTHRIANKHLLQMHSDRLAPIRSADCLAKPHCFATINYLSTENTYGDDWQVEATRNGLCTGLAIWFRAELSEGVFLASEPVPEATRAPSLYGVGFLPWQQPFLVHEGQRFSLGVRVLESLDDFLWTWRWKDAPSAANGEKNTTFGL